MVSPLNWEKAAERVGVRFSFTQSDMALKVCVVSPTQGSWVSWIYKW